MDFATQRRQKDGAPPKNANLNKEILNHTKNIKLGLSPRTFFNYLFLKKHLDKFFNLNKRCQSNKYPVMS
jgi:hypothetical protein